MIIGEAFGGRDREITVVLAQRAKAGSSPTVSACGEQYSANRCSPPDGAVNMARRAVMRGRARKCLPGGRSARQTGRKSQNYRNSPNNGSSMFCRAGVTIKLGSSSRARGRLIPDTPDAGEHGE